MRARPAERSKSREEVRIEAAREARDAELLETAVQAAERAAEVHREAAGSLDPAEWSEKGAADFVTEVDLEAERRIVRALRARFPHHEIVAEEGTEEGPAGAGEGAGGSGEGAGGSGERAGGAARGASGAGAESGGRSGRRSGGQGEESGGPGERSDRDPFRWIVDPLDGTTNFLHGYPEYAVSIAGIDAAGLRVAVVLNSATGERFEATRGGGARRDGEPIRVSPLARLHLALVGTGFPFKREELLPAYLGMFSRVLRATSGIRRGGSAALDLCDLACGRVDAFWELWLMPWDIAAGALIVREAGGAFGPLELESGAAWGEGKGAETLREAAAAAREFATTWEEGVRASESASGLFRGGAYMGANAELLGKLKGVLSGSSAG